MLLTCRGGTFRKREPATRDRTLNYRTSWFDNKQLGL